MSIRLKLTVLLLLIGLVPTVLVGIVAYVTISRELANSTAVQLQSAATRQGQRIGSQIQVRQEEMSRFVNQYNLQVALADYGQNPSTDNRRILNQILLDRIVQSPDMQRVYLTDLEGEIIAASTEGMIGESLADRINVDDPVQYEVRVHPDERDGMNRLYMTAGVNVNAERAALLTIVYRIDEVIAAVQDYTGLGETGETIIAGRNENGNVISLFPLRFDTSAPFTLNLDEMDLYEHAGETVVGVTDYRGEQVILSVAPNAPSDWVLATKIDMEEAYASIGTLGNILIVIGIVSSLAIIGIALAMAQSFAAPILRVARVARRIGEGDFTARTIVRRHDEIGLLGRSINAMGESLEALVARIDEQRTRLEIILNSTTESILAIDKNNKVVMANKAASELSQSTLEGMIGRPINEVFAWQQRGQPIAIYYDTPDVRTYPNLQYTSPDGTLHYLKLIIAKIQNADPAAKAQAIVTIHDETKSRELDDMKIDFVSMAAHELRTPLASLRGYLELVNFKEGQRMSEESQHHIRQALKSTADLGGLINNLLDVTRIERGALVVTPEKIDLTELVTHAMTDMRFNAEGKKITLTFTSSSETRFVHADAIAIREVINNLLTNAIKYTGESGKVDVEILDAPDKFTVKVHDNGIGIPPRALDHLFTKFYRVHGGLDSGSNGTGLGLYIAKSIVERHHGTIGVESEEGVGSTFWFTLPRHQETDGIDANEAANNNVRRHRGWVTKNIAR